jgi:hypothetical protein
MPLDALSVALGRPSFGGGLFQVGQQAGQQGAFKGFNESLQRQQGAERSYMGLLKAGEEGVAGQVASQYNINPQRMEQMQEQFSIQQTREARTEQQKEQLELQRQSLKLRQDAAARAAAVEKQNLEEQKITEAYLGLETKDRAKFEEGLRKSGRGRLAEDLMIAREEREDFLRQREATIGVLSAPVDTSVLESSVATLPEEYRQDFVNELTRIKESQPNFKAGETWATAADKRRAERQLDALSSSMFTIRTNERRTAAAAQRATVAQAADIQDQINDLSQKMAMPKIPTALVDYFSAKYADENYIIKDEDPIKGYENAQAFTRAAMQQEILRLEAQRDRLLGGGGDVLEQLQKAIAAAKGQQ